LIERIIDVPSPSVRRLPGGRKVFLGRMPGKLIQSWRSAVIVIIKVKSIIPPDVLLVMTVIWRIRLQWHLENRIGVTINIVIPPLSSDCGGYLLLLALRLCCQDSAHDTLDLCLIDLKSIGRTLGNFQKDAGIIHILILKNPFPKKKNCNKCNHNNSTNDLALETIQNELAIL